jgi:NAD(P)-dependent dehydrogenase (short-subunit alcohol dehydrogenase family)
MNERQRVAFVTGGSRGIGLACAVALRDQGHLTAVGSRSKPDDLPDGIAWYECDITDDGSIDAAIAGVEEDLGPVQILVANAGITRDLLALRMKTDDFASVVDANLTGTFRVTKRCLRGMMKARWGRIVFMSSVVGSLGQAGQANYAASKAGLAGLGRSLAREFASRGITVNLVAPGPIDTDMLAALSDESVAAMVDSVPVGRVGSAEEVAAAVVYLTSEAAAYTTGATIPVDGGLGMGA